MSSESTRPTRSLRPRPCLNCTDSVPRKPPPPAKKQTTRRKKVTDEPLLKSTHDVCVREPDTAPKPVTQQTENQDAEHDDEMVTLILIPIDHNPMKDSYVQVYEECRAGDSCPITKHAMLLPYNLENFDMVHWPSKNRLKGSCNGANIDLSDPLLNHSESIVNYDSDHSFTLVVDEDAFSDTDKPDCMDVSKAFDPRDSVEVEEKCCKQLQVENVQNSKVHNDVYDTEQKVDDCIVQVNEEANMHERKSVLKDEGRKCSVENKEHNKVETEDGDDKTVNPKYSVNADKHLHFHKKGQLSQVEQEAGDGCVDQDDVNQLSDCGKEYRENVAVETTAQVKSDVEQEGSEEDEKGKEDCVEDQEDEHESNPNEEDPDNMEVRHVEDGEDNPDEEGSEEDEEGKEQSVEDQEDEHGSNGNEEDPDNIDERHAEDGEDNSEEEGSEEDEDEDSDESYEQPKEGDEDYSSTSAYDWELENKSEEGELGDPIGHNSENNADQ
ncbi:high mobility group nucleosome-binding domain-containing protein 5-like [Hyperolius riggenbachi]|uniref:high mobility group nucleosome-binding domain-containing protein 5-like n=1 Tax=Hyperolius riggenbachi TaxID=752182 RepID=UPI0035A33741